MFTMTVQGETLAELGARLLAAADALGNASDAPSAGAGKTTAASATDARTSSQAKKASTPSDMSKQSGAGSDDDELNYDTDVKPHVIKLSKVHGREAAMEILNQFETADDEPAAKGTEVKPEDWPALVTKIKKQHAKLDKAKAAADAED